ncbi:fatty-acyl-CoA synthase [Antricoccus suffuscus]|uniref:Fatty-acyl-CoA synthase n=1 Tax=Antricoccus suffuscus TaxID=1629062 RepID=A0A2T1A0P5_9ACTN|nr:long-chain fatty acid--CoA ligase [Antricoccus suffuscus]PRZ42176.1 fatty-acyl-CoA synthase [Antricoccus suffuscus]
MDHGTGHWPTIHALRNGNQTAFINAETGAATTFRELEDRTNALAAALRDIGVAKGDRVALVTLNGVPMLEILFAIWKLGAIGVPINWRLSASEINYILDDCGAKLIFHSPGFAGTVREAAGEDGRLIEVPDNERLQNGRTSTYETLIAEGDSSRAVADVELDDICTIMYTSGTTGFPKGAMLTHGNFLWNAVHNANLDDGIGRADISIAAAPMFHIGALGIHTTALLYVGGTTVVMETFDPVEWIKAVARHHVTVTFAVPAMWAAIAKAAGEIDYDFSSLRFNLSGGAPTPLVVIEELGRLGAELSEGFGLTETSPIASYLDKADIVEHLGSIGRPVHHVDTRIVDEADNDVPTGVVGEMVFRGPTIFAGYWNKPIETAAAMRGGWFHTGDLARSDEGEYLYIVDRKKDMVITGGENVYPVEVEQALHRHEAIADVAVVGVPDEKWGESVAAVVVLQPNARATGDEIIAWARQRIAHFKCPRSVLFVDELPRTATGKILKRQLRELYVGDSAQ